MKHSWLYGWSFYVAIHQLSHIQETCLLLKSLKAHSIHYVERYFRKCVILVFQLFIHVFDISL